MRQKLLKSGILASAITMVLCGFNWLIGMLSGKILGLTFWGGEYKACCGFGVRLETFYPLYSIDNPIPSTSEMSLDPVSLIVTFAIVLIVILMIRRNKA